MLEFNKTKTCNSKYHTGEKELPIDNFYFSTRLGYYESMCRECKIKASRDWSKKHPEKIRLKNKRYNEIYKERIRKSVALYKQRSRVMSWGRVRRCGTDFISRDEFFTYLNAIPDICAYCSIPERFIDKRYLKTTRLTLDRMDNSKGYIKGNITKACPTCNRVKNDTLTYYEMKDVGEKYIKPKWQEKYRGQF